MSPEVLTPEVLFSILKTLKQPIFNITTKIRQCQDSYNCVIIYIYIYINPLNRSQHTIPRTVDSTGNGSALNTPGWHNIFFSSTLSFVINKQTKLGLHDKLHVIIMRISSCKAGSMISIKCFQMERYLIHRAVDL